MQAVKAHVLTRTSGMERAMSGFSTLLLSMNLQCLPTGGSIIHMLCSINAIKLERNNILWDNINIGVPYIFDGKPRGSLKSSDYYVAQARER